MSNRSGNADLWKQHIGNPDAERLTTSEFDETQPAWSPDGRWIVFRSSADIAVTNTHLLLPMSESRSDIWVVDQVDR